LFYSLLPEGVTRAVVTAFNSGLNAQSQAPESVFRYQNNAPIVRTAESKMETPETPTRRQFAVLRCREQKLSLTAYWT